VQKIAQSADPMATRTVTKAAELFNTNRTSDFFHFDMDMTAIELLSMSCGHYFSPVFFDVQSLIIACSSLLLYLLL